MPDIDFQKIVLNLIPKKGDDPVIFYASQYETARPFIADLMWGETEFAPGDDCRAEIDIRKNDDCRAEIDIRKNDDNLVVITDDVSIDNNEVSVILPVQALTCIGKNLGQVKIYAADDQLVCALNFILEVQADPLAGGVTSETAIDNLTEQIEEITQQVIGDDYYDKTEVDSVLALKADKLDTYTKTQVDNALALKADVSDLPDMTDYYTKTATDALLDEKADADTTYTKAEVDALIDGIFPTLTASGSIASFTTALSKQLVSVTTDPLATTVTACGVNLFSDVFSDYRKPVNYYIKNIPLEEGKVYTLKARLKDGGTAVSGCYFGVAAHGEQYAEFQTDLYPVIKTDGTTVTSTLTINSVWTSPKLAVYVANETAFDSIIENYDISLTEGTAEYTPYNGQTVPISDAATLVTQSGINNVFADVGDVTVQYKYMSM